MGFKCKFIDNKGFYKYVLLPNLPRVYAFAISNRILANLLELSMETEVSVNKCEFVLIEKRGDTYIYREN
jgi:hypothetical protein